LQSHFAAHDVSYPVYEAREEPVKDFTIYDYEYSDFEIENRIKLSFLKDYVSLGLDKIHERYFEGFRKEIDRNGLYTTELLQGIASRYYNQINEISQIIRVAKYLPLSVRAHLHVKLTSLRELIEEFVKDPYPNFQTKIKVNWSRTDVIYFFHLLRLNKSINHIEDADLGNIIDTCFEYLDTKEGTYKPIVKSRKHLNEFKNAKRSMIDASKRLKELLQHDDFFSH
jgi:hypothetical protein